MNNRYIYEHHVLMNDNDISFISVAFWIIWLAQIISHDQFNLFKYTYLKLDFE